MEIKWKELFLVTSVSIAVAVIVSALFAIGVRLLTNAQHAVPGARKGKAADVRKEIINRVFAYISFALSASALTAFLLGIVFPKVAKAIVGGFFGLES
jgi:hypothetical protein